MRLALPGKFACVNQPIMHGMRLTTYRTLIMLIAFIDNHSAMKCPNFCCLYKSTAIEMSVTVYKQIVCMPWPTVLYEYADNADSALNSQN